MQRLLSLLIKYRFFITFIILQALCWWLIFQNNTYHGAAFFNTSNAAAANVLQSKKGVRDYFELKKINQNLAKENALLREMIADKNQQYNYLLLKQYDGPAALDSSYQFEVAKVINNSYRAFKNHLTINKGRNDGIETGMGVISGTGIVGRVKAVTNNYATIVSLLHVDMMVSSMLKGSGTFCTTQWDGKNPRLAQLDFVPRHIEVEKGEKVVTSGYNAIFPPDILVGSVKEAELKDNATFYDITIELSNDFSRLDYVYVVKNHQKIEIDSLQNLTLQRND